MNFKDWKIKILFHKIEFDSVRDERHETVLMEHTLAHLINECDFMPRQGDLIGDLEGYNAEDQYVIDLISLNVGAKTLLFVLSLEEED